MVMADLVVVGHVAIDRIITKGGDRTQLGGPPTYVSLIAKRLGLDVEAFTKVGGDMPASFREKLKELGINLRGQIVEEAATTRFTLDYRGARRRLSVESVCEEIMPEDVRDLHEAVLIAPIVGEVPPSTASALTEARLVALDPQGFVREIRRDGVVQPRRWFAPDLLRSVTIYKSSGEELKLVTGEASPWRGLRKILDLGAEVALATMGGRGTLLLTIDGSFKISAYETVEVVDPTGAGDAFMGGFLSEYLGEGEAPWCAAVGAAAASCVIETAGASINLSMREIRRRAVDLYEGVVKL